MSEKWAVMRISTEGLIQYRGPDGTWLKRKELAQDVSEEDAKAIVRTLTRRKEKDGDLHTYGEVLLET